MARTQADRPKIDTPSLFDAPHAPPVVRIGGVDPTFIEPASEAPPPRPPAAPPHADSEEKPHVPKPPAAATKRTATQHAATKHAATQRSATQRAATSKPAAGKDRSARTPIRAPRRQATAETMAGRQRDISVSEFFAKNRHLLGFDNKRKALLTTVKEAVDNSLDACEEGGMLPELHVAIDQLAEDRFRVTVRDNGPGIVRGQIPNIFGKLLYGSKFHRLKMSRGQQGIGISAAGMYGLLTTGRPVHVTSRTSPRKAAHHFQIAIDTTKNRPDIIADEEVEVDWARGTSVAIELVASYAKGRQSVDEYIEQTAIANPHAQIHYRNPNGEHLEFPRGTEDMPAETQEIKPHPYGIELGVLMKMLKENKPRKKGERAPGLSGFLQLNFSRVTSRVAQQICQHAKLSPRARCATLSTHEIERLYQAMQQVKVMAPPTNCLAPIGTRNLLAGVCKELKAEFYTAAVRRPTVYRGNPFQIEIALAYGGNLPADQAARVLRFANRVPLLYQQSACCAFKSVLDVDWRNYGLSQPGGGIPVGPLVVLVHIASVWVPFTSESKEAIADYDEIRKEIKLCLMECGRKLGSYLRQRRRQRLEADKRNIFERYIPDVAEALHNIAGVDEQRMLKELQRLARMRTEDADMEFDEDGRRIRKKADAAAGLAQDDSTVIVEEHQVTPTAEGLFDEPGNGGNGKHKNGRASRRRKRR